MRLTSIRKSEGKTFSAVFAGDVCPKYPETQKLVTEHSEVVAAGLKSYFDSADLKIMQWEAAVTEDDTPIVKSGPNLKCPKECLNLGKAFGIDVMLLANNHVGDYGPDAVNETIKEVQNAGFKYVGAGANLEDAKKALYLDCKGLRTAIINFAENEFGTAGKNKPGVAPLSPFENIRQIREARKNADIVIVAIHGGHEHYTYPSPRMVEVYRQFADAGADLVWNCHTHCVLGMEVYNGVPVVYSPGNFFFPYNIVQKGSWSTGYVTKFHFDEKGVYAFEVQPYIFTQETVLPLTEEQEKSFFEHFEKISAVIQNPEQLQAYFETWCTMTGVDYLGGINGIHSENYPPDWQQKETVQTWIHIRNLFTCEAHNDMIRQTLRLIEEGRVKEAAARQEELKAAWEPAWLTK